MDVLQAIQFIIRSWDEITPETIRNCWNHTKILPIITTDSDATNTPTLGELSQMLTSLNLPDTMSIEEFLSNGRRGGLCSSLLNYIGGSQIYLLIAIVKKPMTVLSPE